MKNYLCKKKMNNPYHPILRDRQVIKDALRLINDKINGCGFDFMEDTEGKRPSIAFANSHEGDRSLIILASFDFSYYHNLELVFYDVAHTDISPGSRWWDNWSGDQIELSDESNSDYFEFRFNRGPGKTDQYQVRAKGFSYLFEQVSHRL